MKLSLQMPPKGGNLAQIMMWAHDSLTKVLFVASMLAATYLTLVLSWEVVARYWLKSPSGWAPDTASISFGLIIFLAAPMLAWQHGHAHMNIVVNALPPNLSQWLQRFTMLIACFVCLVAAWFGWTELLRLYQRGVMMISATPIPKWWLMTTIVYALLSSGLYYLRHFLCSFSQSHPSNTASEVQ